MEWNGIEYNIKGEKSFDIKEGNAKGKEYDKNGNLIFEGEYYNGKKWNGIEYDGNSGKKKFKIIQGDSDIENAKDSWFFGERYYGGYKVKQEFYKNGKLKYEGNYIGDDKFEKYDENGEIYESINIAESRLYGLIAI